MRVIITESQFNEKKYSDWKKANITYRGLKNIGQPNNDFGANVLGEGLYTVPRSNIKMARQYGDLYFVLNGRPKKPLTFKTLNEWEIWFQYNLLKPYDFKRRDFEANTTIRAEMLKLGYDGVIITSREMVNYTPEDVLYFANERQLLQYYTAVIEQE